MSNVYRLSPVPASAGPGRRRPASFEPRERLYGGPVGHAAPPLRVDTQPSADPLWPLLSLALGTFALGTEAFMIAAILPRIADDLSVGVATAGQLVAVFTLSYAISSPILTTLAASVDRRKLLIASMALFIAGNVSAASASGYGWLLLARVAQAFAAGLFAPNAFALAGVLAPKERRGRALAIVNGGFSVAVALGVPVGAFIGGHLGWRMTFIGVAALSMVALLGLSVGLPKGVGQGLSVPTFRERLAAVREPGALPALLVTTLWAVGGYTVYTFIAPFLKAAAALDTSQVAYFLFCWGGSAFVGLILGGFANDKLGPRPVIFTVLLLMAAALSGLSLTAALVSPLHALPVVLAAAAVWGLTAWAFAPAQQARLVSVAGLRNAPLILSLNSSFQYLGFSLGAGLGSITVAFGGVLELGWVGGACVLAGLLMFLVAGRRVVKS